MGSTTTLPLGEPAHECERVAGNLSYVDNTPLDGSPQRGAHCGPREPIHASVLVGQCSAHPRLHVAHVPLEPPSPGPAHPAHLPDRPAQPVHAIPHVLHAVPHRRMVSSLHAFGAGQLSHKRRGGPGSGQAHGQRSVSQLTRALLDVLGVHGEGLHADRRIARGAAVGLDEIHWARPRWGSPGEGLDRGFGRVGRSSYERKK